MSSVWYLDNGGRKNGKFCAPAIAKNNIRGAVVAGESTEV